MHVADSDPVDIAANYGQRPHRAIFTDDDVADDDRGVVDITARADDRGFILIIANHCFALPEETRIVTIFS